MADEEKKQPGADGEDQPPTETQLEQQRNPDEAAFAEQAIHEYTVWILDQFRESAMDAIDALSGWVASQADPTAFDNQGLFAQLNKTFTGAALHAFGGADSPIAQAMLPILSDTVDQAERQETEASLFINEMTRAMRDATWYLRDNLQGILANHWDQLLDLAYEGSTDFIPVLHRLGLPSLDFNAASFTHKLKATAEQFSQSVPKKQEEVEQQAEGDKPKPEEEEAADKGQEQFQDEEQSKKAV
jgi:hypothetical protein